MASESSGVLQAGGGPRLLGRFVCAAVAVAALLDAGSRSVTWANDAPPPAEGTDDSHRYQAEILQRELENPWGVAIRPSGRGASALEAFVAESGAGRVIAVDGDATGEPRTVIVDFPVGALAENEQLPVGPLGLDFLTRDRLAVGTGGLGAGGDILRVYDLADGTEPRAYDAAEQTLGPIVASGRSATGEGALASLSHSEQAAFVVPRVGDRRGWILKAILDGGRLAGLEPFLPVGETTGGDVPSALVINPKPHFHYLVAAHGARTAASRVTMFSPASGAVALRLNTGLRHIVGLAYSPSGDLYAVDYGGDDPASGGVYRLEAAKVERRESCRPVKIADAPRPTALAFSPDGLLYVTALGEHSGDDPATGVLLRIAPLTETPKL